MLGIDWDMLDQIWEHGEAHDPEEGAGFILGRLTDENRYAEHILGVFHSHPDHPAVPSEFDRESAFPWFTYVITGVYQDGARESRTWRLSDERQFEQVQVIIHAGHMESRIQPSESQHHCVCTRMDNKKFMWKVIRLA